MLTSDDELKEFLTEGVPVSHPSDTLLLDWTTRIRAGERGPEIDGIARYIIKDFRLRQVLGVQQSTITLDFLGSALDALLAHADIDEAFGLMPRKNSRPRNVEKDLDIAYWVAMAQQRGHEKSESIALAAEAFHTDISNVRRKVRECPLDWMNQEAEVWERYFLEKGKPLPQAKEAGKK